MSLQVVPDFRVVDETADWLVVEKPAPLIVHPANDKPEPTLLGGLERLCSYEIENGACLGIVTRLDRETSGLVLVAKHTAAARELGLIFERREACKEYLAIVKGHPAEDVWVCDAPIVRAGEIGPSDIWVRQVVDARGRECITAFSVELRFVREGSPYSLVRCFPETGRMHQIRVHLAHSGHPIAGDKLYSGNGSEYLEWMEKGWNAALRCGWSFRATRCTRAGWASLGKAASIAGNPALPPDLGDFIDGKPVGFAEGVVNWSRRDY